MSVLCVAEHIEHTEHNAISQIRIRALGEHRNIGVMPAAASARLFSRFVRQRTEAMPPDAYHSDIHCKV